MDLTDGERDCAVASQDVISWPDGNESPEEPPPQITHQQLKQSLSQSDREIDVAMKVEENKNGVAHPAAQTGDRLPPRRRRTAIPERPNQSINLWSVLKNAIGKELTKIPVPVNFSEPLSMLQRITEDFEYAELLHKAAKIDNSCEQLAYIAALCVSQYATTSVRTGKYSCCNLFKFIINLSLLF